MDINATSYEGLQNLSFGANADAVRSAFGAPKMTRTNRSGEELFHYDGFVICLASGRFREITIEEECGFSLNGIGISWTEEGLKELCQRDNSPKICFGAVVLLDLGVSLTGIGEMDSSERAVSLFRKGDWDEFTNEMVPYTL